MWNGENREKQVLFESARMKRGCPKSQVTSVQGVRVPRDGADHPLNHSHRATQKPRQERRQAQIEINTSASNTKSLLCHTDCWQCAVTLLNRPLLFPASTSIQVFLAPLRTQPGLSDTFPNTVVGKAQQNAALNKVWILTHEVLLHIITCHQLVSL